MRSPFAEVTVKGGGKIYNITHLVESLLYDDAVDKDNVATFKLYAGRTNEIVDSPWLIAGYVVSFFFGYSPQERSKKYTCRISDINVKYEGRIKIEFKGITVSNVGKKRTSTTIWSGLSAVIIGKLAEKNKLTFKNRAPLNKVYESLPQANKSDMELINEIVKDNNTNGTLVVLIDSHTLTIKEREVGVARFKYSYGNTDMLSFAPKYKESKATGSANTAKAISVNDSTGEVITTSSQDKTPSLGKEKQGVFGVSNDGNTSDEAFQPAASEGLENIAIPDIGLFDLSLPADAFADIPDITEIMASYDKEEQTSSVNQQASEAKLKTLEATLKVNGNPFITSDITISIANVSAKHGGLWYVTKVNHAIKAGGAYVSTLTLNKAGVTKASSIVAKKVDTSQQEIVQDDPTLLDYTPIPQDIISPPEVWAS